MLETRIYNASNPPTEQLETSFIDFLFTHLEQYGDKKEDIKKAFDYALMRHNGAGGFVIAGYDNGTLAGVSIINKTGMEGYIPENILVYIATHKDIRGKGIGTQLMEQIIETAEGNIALHVEHDNPAVHLYKKMGFTNKYLEMRLNKKDLKNGILNA